MKNVFPITFCILAGICGGFFAAARYRAEAPSIDLTALLPPDEHKVTAEMIARTDALARKPAPDFEATGIDGKTYTRSGLAAGKPLVLVFIKIGCPCSTSAQAYFNRIAEAYRGRAHVVGVIDGDRDAAEAWVRAHRVKHLLLLDPELKLVKAFGAESSVYVALVTPDGRLDEFWPGYSADMLAELGRRLARFSGSREVAFDTSGAPGDLSTGCSY